jgi:hypothetical protein
LPLYIARQSAGKDIGESGNAFLEVQANLSSYGKMEEWEGGGTGCLGKWLSPWIRTHGLSAAKPQPKRQNLTQRRKGAKVKPRRIFQKLNDL